MRQIDLGPMETDQHKIGFKPCFLSVKAVSHFSEMCDQNYADNDLERVIL